MLSSWPPEADRPDLACWQRVGADAVLAPQFWGGHEFLDPVQTHRVAEVRVAELGRSDALLLFLHTTTDFKGETYRPFQVVVRDSDSGRPDREASTDRIRSY